MPATAQPFLLAASSALALCLLNSGAAGEVEGKVEEFSHVTIEGSIIEPEPLELPGEQQLREMIELPDDFELTLFAENLINPRMLAVAEDGTLYATRRSVGDVLMLKDEDGDGRADVQERVASRPGMHGIALDGDQVFLVTIREVYRAPIEADGSFGELERIIDDLPDAGQHPNRTIAIGPDDKLYISVGSTCNSCNEDNPENATLLRAEKDGSSRTIFASGLRNTIGFDWHPESGTLYGMDHGTDWLGDDEHTEELNLIEQGKQYGWPFVYDDGQFNPKGMPPEGVSLEDWARMSTEPLMGYTPHSAPMQMAFHSGRGLPEGYRHDAFVAMRGSWNRQPPSGYEILRIDFEEGEPQGFESFASGFLVEQEDGSYGHLARLAGLAVAPDGAIYVSDDSNGAIYRIAYSGETEAAAAGEPEIPDKVPEPPQSELALELLGGDDNADLEISGSFSEGETIPFKHTADGDDASPALSWQGAPEGTRSFALLMEDPDASQPRPFVHWILYDIPTDVQELREGLPPAPVLQEPEDAKQGANSRGSLGYFGPKPPRGDGPHTYSFQLFALDTPGLELDPGASREEVLDAMEGHVLASGSLSGEVERPAQPPEN